MLRNILLVAPLVAFGLSFAAPQPSAARPLAGQTQQARWCEGEGCGSGDSDDDDGDGDACEDTTICVYGVFELCDEDRQGQRAACTNTCAQLAANSCAASLGASSPADLATCKTDLAARCAASCTRPQILAIVDPKRGGSHPHDDDDHDDDDGDGCSDNCVTLEASACVTISHE